ncbi:MAG TPA: hypothetical protein PLP29_05765 [Candidatus Ozemobacteraceae bacterium]|nr:hypothetical protein [Candidatus Ozemobacteraceae bacterium]
MLEALRDAPSSGFFVVDIGDSAGTHMRYLRGLLPDHVGLETLSVNLDPRAVEKIRERGLPALLCRAEELSLDHPIHLFVSFEMLEHLHNPAIFFRRLSRDGKGRRLALTVPYLRQSRVGLHHVRSKDNSRIYAEDEHIFELSPADWTLLIEHSGWKVVQERIYYQYPRGIPVVSSLMASYWRWFDFEGFWGVILEPDPTYADSYLDWEG